MRDPVLIWFLVGIGLMLLEFVAPGLVVFFFGVGALVVSLASYLGLVDSLFGQMLLFSVVSILSIFLLRTYVKSWFVGDSSDSDDEMRNEFVGKVVKVVREIPGGLEEGRVELKGADWKACSDKPHIVGDMVKVTARDGLVLTVKSAE